MIFEKRIGRLTVTVSDSGAGDHHYSHGATVECRTARSPHSETTVHTMSIEELRDLHYAIGRALAFAEARALAEVGGGA